MTVVDFIVLTVLRGCLYSLLALGMSLIYGVGRIINLAHTALYMLAAFGLYHLAMRLHWPMLASMIVIVVGITAIGLLVYRYLLDRIRQHGAAVLIVTVALAIAIQELMQQLMVKGYKTTLPRDITSILPGEREILGTAVYDQQLLMVGTAVVVVIIVWLVLSKTKLGISIRATANDPEVASLMGISVSRTLMATMAIGTALAGVAAVLVAPLQGAIYYMWLAPLMMILVIVVLGGLGSIKGSIIGAFIIALVEALVFALIPAHSYLYTMVALAVMVVVLVVRPAGLFGTLFEEERL
jgi:branched-chain amino acid transport system permease protein